MGNKPTTNKTVSKVEKTVIKEQLKQKTTDNLSNFQQNLAANVSPDNFIQTQALYNVAETAKTQLSRGGEQFTKSDLIAIIKCMDTSKDIGKLQSLTCDDLRAIIRGKVYDVNHYLDNKQIAPLTSSEISIRTKNTQNNEIINLFE